MHHIWIRLIPTLWIGLTMAVGARHVAAADTLHVDDCTVELRQPSGRTVWKSRLPTPPKSAFRATARGWASDDGIVLDHAGRWLSRHSGRTTPSSAAAISNGAWDPTTTIVDKAETLIGPVFTAEGDVAAIALRQATVGSFEYLADSVRSQGASGNWDAPEPLPVDWFQGALIPDGQGHLTYVYRDFNNPVSAQTLSAIRYSPEAGWGAPEIIGRVSTFFQTVTGAADALGNLVVAFGEFGGPVYTVSWAAASQTWGAITTLTGDGELPTITVSPDRNRIVLAYGKNTQGMELRSYTAAQGWSPPRPVPGTNRLIVYGSSFSRLPVLIDDAGNLTVYWEARVGFLFRFWYAVYGVYLPAEGSEPVRRLLPWELSNYVSLYEFGDWGLSPAGNALAVVTRFTPQGVDCLAMFHSAVSGWQPTATPFQYANASRTRSRMAWRNDETALAVVRNSTGGLTTLFFKDSDWSEQTQNLPAGAEAFIFQLASRNADIVGLFLATPGLNATWYRGPPITALRSDVKTGRRSTRP